jgi:hypothetical protein
MSTTDLTFQPATIPSECPVCGAYSLAPEANVSILLAVCDVLVVKALAQMGKYIIRSERSRHNAFGDRPMHLAHMVWTPAEAIVSKALRGAWDVVPMLLETHGTCCEYDSAQVVVLLDTYVHDLAITGTEHDIEELAYRLRERLGLPVYRTVVAHQNH